MAVYAVHQSEPKFLFIINYKVMYSSLKGILPEYYENIQFFNKAHVKSIKFNDFIKVGIVRNPYDRTVSTYFDKCINAPKICLEQESTQLQYCQAQILETLKSIRHSNFKIALPAILYSLEKNPEERRLLNRNFEYLQSISFEEFVQCLSILLAKKKVDGHFKQQYKAYIVRRHFPFFIANKLFENTSIFKLENLNDDWKTICNLLGKEMRLQKINKTNGERSNFKNYYTDKSREIISKLYKKDFSRFKYSLDL